VEIERSDSTSTGSSAPTPIAFGAISSLYPTSTDPTPSDFTLIATVPGQTEVYVDWLPSDGFQRSYRARHILDGLIPSAYTPTVYGTPNGIPDTIARPNIGPTLDVSVSPDVVAYSISYVSNGLVYLEIDGATSIFAPSSPITAIRTAADQAYTFSATLNGQTISDTVIIPAYGSAPVVPSFLTYGVSTTVAPDCAPPTAWESQASWTLADADNVTYFIRVTDAAGIVYAGAENLDCADGDFTYVGATGDPMFTGTFQFFPAKAQICLRSNSAVIVETAVITDEVETGPAC